MSIKERAKKQGWAWRKRSTKKDQPGATLPLFKEEIPTRDVDVDLLGERNVYGERSRLGFVVYFQVGNDPPWAAFKSPTAFLAVRVGRYADFEEACDALCRACVKAD